MSIDKETKNQTNFHLDKIELPKRTFSTNKSISDIALKFHTKPLQKSSSEFSGNQNPLKQTGKGIVNSIGLPLVSSRALKNNFEKIKIPNNKFWQNKFKLNVESERSSKKKASFIFSDSKLKKKQFTDLLNQEIEDFEKRLEHFRNIYLTKNRIEMYRGELKSRLK